MSDRYEHHTPTELVAVINGLEAERLEAEATVARLTEEIKTAHADGADAIIASFAHTDLRGRICELEVLVERLTDEIRAILAAKEEG